MIGVVDIVFGRSDVVSALIGAVAVTTGLNTRNFNGRIEPCTGMNLPTIGVAGGFRVGSATAILGDLPNTGETGTAENVSLNPGRTIPAGVDNRFGFGVSGVLGDGNGDDVGVTTCVGGVGGGGAGDGEETSNGDDGATGGCCGPINPD